MRGVRCILVLAGGLALGQDAHSQTYPAEMVVTATQVEARSGPTKEYYATSILKQGTRVFVLRESKDQPGWLAIVPPQGSFSWVNRKHVKQVNPRVAYVELEGGPVPVMPGSAVVKKAPNVESGKIQPGSILVIVDTPLSVDGETWLPIAPPPTEVRFIPADAVRSVNTGIPFAPTPAGNPLITQADEAYNSGQRDKARLLYKEAAERSTDNQEKLYCYSRLVSIDKGAAPAAGHPFHMAAGKGAVPAPVSQAVGKSITYPPQWSSWGLLKKAPFEKDNQPVYLLESKEGRALLHVISQPGASLRDYVGRTVCIYGSITYRTDDPLRRHYLIASHVAVPPP